MAKEYTFTIKHDPVNDLFGLDLQSHLDSMAKFGWALISTQRLIGEHNSTPPQIIFFWGKDE